MIVRSALIQTTGSVVKEENIVKHIELIEEAANQGSQITCLQELFFSPYFCQVQDAKWYSQAEPIPGPTTRRMQEVAKRHSMVLVVPLYEEEAPGIYYNTAVVIDADGTLLGKYRKTHVPHLPHFWEKFYFRPGNLGYPVFKTKYGQVGVYICYDRHFPEGARILGLHDAEAEYILVGASTVQVGTAVMFQGYKIVEKMKKGLSAYMDEKGFESVAQMRGYILPQITAHEELNFSYKVVATIDQALCSKCGLCYTACLDGGWQAIEMESLQLYPRVVTERCDGCSLCLHVCPVEGCITLVPA